MHTSPHFIDYPVTKKMYFVLFVNARKHNVSLLWFDSSLFLFVQVSYAKTLSTYTIIPPSSFSVPRPWMLRAGSGISVGRQTADRAPQQAVAATPPLSYHHAQHNCKSRVGYITIFTSNYFQIACMRNCVHKQLFLNCMCNSVLTNAYSC